MTPRTIGKEPPQDGQSIIVRHGGKTRISKAELAWMILDEGGRDTGGYFPGDKRRPDHSRIAVMDALDGDEIPEDALWLPAEEAFAQPEPPSPTTVADMVALQSLQRCLNCQGYGSTMSWAGTRWAHQPCKKCGGSGWAPPNALELGLCETEHLVLRPNIPYVFRVMPDCKRCAELAKTGNPPGNPVPTPMPPPPPPPPPNPPDFGVTGAGCASLRHGRCCANCANFNNRSGNSILSDTTCSRWDDHFTMPFALCDEWTPHPEIAQEVAEEAAKEAKTTGPDKETLLATERRNRHDI